MFIQKSGIKQKIQLQLMDNQKLGTNRLYKREDKNNFPRMGNTSGNSRKNGERRIIGQAGFDI